MNPIGGVTGAVGDADVGWLGSIDVKVFDFRYREVLRYIPVRWSKDQVGRRDPQLTAVVTAQRHRHGSIGRGGQHKGAAVVGATLTHTRSAWGERKGSGDPTVVGDDVEGATLSMHPVGRISRAEADVHRRGLIAIGNEVLHSNQRQRLRHIPVRWSEGQRVRGDHRLIVIG